MWTTYLARQDYTRRMSTSDSSINILLECGLAKLMLMANDSTWTIIMQPSVVVVPSVGRLPPHR